MADLRADRTRSRLPDRVPPWFHVGVVVLVVVGNLAQRPGLTTFDTKLDLQVDPWAFMVRSLSVWNPDSAWGELQNQATGYLFPLGPWYALGGLVGVPTWIWERLWSAALVLIAYEGMRRVAKAWGGLSPWSAVLAGGAYALAPRVLGTIGFLTGETLATVVLPWTVLPLVLCLRGRIGLLPAAVMSAATVPFMGGHNATEVLCALVLPGLLVLLADAPGDRRLRLAALWGGLVVVVCLWWLVPLLVLGRYGSPFLDYIESARTTTDQVGWFMSLRGSTHWVTYLDPGATGDWLAGFELATDPLLVAATAVVGGAGLVGLALHRLPDRRVLVLTLLVGLFALTAGSGGLAGSVLDGAWTSALDGALAPFRNVHKFDPVVRFPLALGFGAVVEVLLRRPRNAHAAHASRVRTAMPVAVAVALVGGLLVTAQPVADGGLRGNGGWASMPGAWRDAAAFLREQEGPVRVLLAPAAGFAVQTWGRTTDEPLQTLDASPWSARTRTPLMPPGTIRLMDAIEAIFVGARPDAGLSATLDRAGITHLVVRNDLDYRSVDAPSPEAVHRVLDTSPGLLQVAAFGRAGLYPQVEVYAVASDQGDPRIRLFRDADAMRVAGGAEALPALTRTGVLDAASPMLRSTAQDAEVDVLTDTGRRVERTFARDHEATSDLMSSADDYRFDRAVHDYSYPDAVQPTLEYAGIDQVLASSSRGYADAGGQVLPEEAPYAAVDDSLFTTWTTAPFAEVVGSWIELRFSRPTVLGRTHLQFDVRGGARITKVALDSAGSHRVLEVGSDGGTLELPVEPAPTTYLKVSVLDAGSGDRPVRLSDIAVAGLPRGRSLVLGPGIGTGGSVVLEGDVQRPACTPFYAGLSCRESSQRLSTDALGWRREIQVEQPGVWRIQGAAVAAPGNDVADLMTPLDPRLVKVSASSSFGGDASTVPQNAFDGQGSTSWIASSTDERPILELSWRKPRTVTRILPVLSPGVTAEPPSALVVRTDDRTQLVRLGESGTGFLDPVRTRSLRISLVPGIERRDDGVPLGVSELRIDGLEDLAYHADPSVRTGRVCGLGPTIEVGDTVVRTRVAGTVGAVIAGSALAVVPCGGAAGGVIVPAGQVPVKVTNQAGFELRDLVLLPVRQTGTGAGTDDPRAEVVAWGSTRRSIDVATTTAGLLAVTQSLNPGWVATLEGRPLDAVEVDGWMQGWSLPAGSVGRVHLRFTPQTSFAWGLGGGLVAAALVMVLGLLLALRVRVRPGVEPPVIRQGRQGVGSALVLVGLALVSVPACLGGVVGRLLRPRSERGYLVVLTGVVVLGVLVGAGVGDLDLEAANVLVATAVGLVVGPTLGRSRPPARHGVSS